MGLKLKEQKQAATEAAVPIKIPYYMLQVIAGLIGKIKCNTYESFDLIRGKTEALHAELKKIGEKAGGDQEKANVIWKGDSDLTKTEFAWLERETFKTIIPELGLNAEQIGILEFWVVKED